MLKLTSYIPAIVCFAVAVAPAALADSPLTSTPFASAYQDVRVVRYAGDRGLDRKVFEALSDRDIPNDVRAAIVNQIGWSNEPQANAKSYLDYIARSRKTDPSRLKLSMLTAEESMALGYLLAMDNRFSPMEPIGGRGQVQQTNAISLMNDAARKAPDDFSVALIRGLIQANIDLRNNWCLVYQDVNQVLEDFSGDYNMRTEAMDIIMDYMNEYQSYCTSR